MVIHPGESDDGRLTKAPLGTADLAGSLQPAHFQGIDGAVDGVGFLSKPTPNHRPASSVTWTPRPTPLRPALITIPRVLRRVLLLVPVYPLRKTLPLPAAPLSGSRCRGGQSGKGRTDRRSDSRALAPSADDLARRLGILPERADDLV